MMLYFIAPVVVILTFFFGFKAAMYYVKVRNRKAAKKESDNETRINLEVQEIFDRIDWENAWN